MIKRNDKNLEKKFAQLNLPPELQWENLTLSNDFLFGCVMRNVDLCTEMARRILPDMDIGHIVLAERQYTLKGTLDSRGVRLDLYAASDKRKLAVFEAQTSNKNDLPRRSKAYMIYIGNDVMNKDKMLLGNGTYNDIPDTFIVFICTFDPFSDGRHIYTFRNTCVENNELTLNDGSYTIFLNAKGTKNDISVELKAFLDIFIGKSSDDPFVRAIEAEMKIAKQNTEMRRDYMFATMHDREKIGEGITIGETRTEERVRNNLHSLFKSMGYSEQQISAFTKTALSKSDYEE